MTTANQLRYARMICKKYGVPLPTDEWDYNGENTIGGIAKAVLPPEELELWFDENANEVQKATGREKFFN